MNRRPGQVDVITEVGYCPSCGRTRNLRREEHHLGTLVRAIVTCETCHRTLSSSIGVASADPAQADAEAAPAQQEAPAAKPPARQAATKTGPNKPTPKRAAAKKPAAKKPATRGQPASTPTRKVTKRK
jgi:hypothetical protein